MTNQQYLLAARPVGLPKNSDWEYKESPAPKPSDGELLLRVLYISIDPAMRGWMNEGKSYIDPVAIGDVMRALAIGRVVESNHPDFQVGDHVSGGLGVQSYALSDGKGLMKVDPEIAPLPLYLSALGMPGMTAYFGLLEVGQPNAGETLVVSGASGAVGSVVGQIGKIKGCRVVGLAGGEKKCSYLVKDLGFDAAIDYKSQDLRTGLKEHCPHGIDVYFDNVGGEILDTVLTRINRGARIPICGAISQYNNTTAVKGPSNYLSLLVNRARMQGFVVFDFAGRYQEAAQEMGLWLAQGKLKSKEHIVEGIETFPETLLMLFSGENYGKLIIKVADS
ncbi:MAG: NADP-dependent oxidoreductase [bacterium]